MTAQLNTSVALDGGPAGTMRWCSFLPAGLQPQPGCLPRASLPAAGHARGWGPACGEDDFAETGKGAAWWGFNVFLPLGQIWTIKCPESCKQGCDFGQDFFCMKHGALSSRVAVPGIYSALLPLPHWGGTGHRRAPTHL